MNAEDSNPGVCSYPWQQMIIDLTGEVVPCCFWSGYRNTGKPLGNTNVNSLEEIWNGEGYRALRQANASGKLDGHPCNRCVAYQWGNGHYPPFSWPVSFKREEGHCFIAPLPERLEHELDPTDIPGLRVLENGKPLPIPDAIHDDIRNLGAGRYSVWGKWIYFSSSDNSDPITNGRAYVLERGALRSKLASVDTASTSGKNILKAHHEYLAGKEVVDAKPTMISLISTADCNIDCPACSQNLVRLANVQHRHETVPNVLSLVPYLHQFIWHGGEPYLIKRFRQFVDEFQTSDNPNLTFGFTSNGTMLTAKELEKLQKFPYINASISVDSFVPQTFEKIRLGASYDLVIENLLRAVKSSGAPIRTFSCGMIICKSNFKELPINLQFAIDHDIGLNLSPVVIYPVTEQLDVFEDFERETRGWLSSLAEADRIVRRGRADNRLALRRVDPAGMLDKIRDILRASEEKYRTIQTLRVVMRDPGNSISRMRRPGIIVRQRDRASALCYVQLQPGRDEYLLRIPATIARDEVCWVFVHDLLEEVGAIQSGYWQETLRIEVPAFVEVPRPRNIAVARYGESTRDGLKVTEPEDISRAYERLLQLERDLGRGAVTPGFRGAISRTAIGQGIRRIAKRIGSNAEKT